MTIDEFTAMLDEYMVWYRDKRIKTEYGMSIMDKRIQLGLMRLKPSGTLTNDHTDNEVQQNVTTPGYSLDLSVFSLCKVVLSGGSILTQMCTVCCQRLCSFAGQLPGNPG